FLCDRVELVEQHEVPARREVVKNQAQVGGRLSEERRDDGIEAYDDPGNSELGGEDLARERLPATWRTHEQQPRDGTQTPGPKHVAATLFRERFFEDLANRGRDDEVFQTPDRLADLQERHLAFAVDRDGRKREREVAAV